MFRLIKLAFYALVGYALYELFQGMKSEQFSSGGRSGGSRALNRAMGSNEGRMQTLTGEGRGLRESTLESSGTSIPHQVGRGAVTP